MWLIIFALVLIASIAGIIFLVSGFHRFSFIKKLSEKNKKLSWALSVVPVALIAVLPVLFINVWATMIILIHLFIFWLVCDLIGKLVRKLCKKEMHFNIEGCIAIVSTAVYLGIGWYLAHHVFRTEYTLTTGKKLGQDSLRIVEIADLHAGITLSCDEFDEQCRRINDEKPDVVIVSGDFVDDDTTEEEMLSACRSLGSINARYGIYFTLGNHDKGYYSSRGFSIEDMYAEMEKNSITVLEDKAVLVNDSFYIIGRKDKSDEKRLEMDELMKDVDKSRYIIVSDHQPNDYDNEADAGADLVLSGHTHGGHIFPAGQIGLIIGANDSIYGCKTRGSTNFIVTSGISGWAIPFKTGTVSEYVVIDVNEIK